MGNDQQRVDNNTLRRYLLGCSVVGNTVAEAIAAVAIDTVIVRKTVGAAVVTGAG